MGNSVVTCKNSDSPTQADGGFAPFLSQGSDATHPDSGHSAIHEDDVPIRRRATADEA